MPYLNNFGADSAGLLALLPGIVEDDLADAISGASGVARLLDRATSEVFGCLPAAWQRRITQQMEFVELAGPALGGEATFNLPLTPAVSGTVLVYRLGERPTIPPDDVDDHESGITPTTTQITISPVANEGEWIYARYVIDTSDASFRIDGLDDLIETVAAAEAGQRLWSDQAAGEWALVTRYIETAKEKCEMMKAGKWLPLGITQLTMWSSGSAAFGSVARKRG